jgi:hypothetical protein
MPKRTLLLLAAVTAAAPPAGPALAQTPPALADREAFLSAARTAWVYVENNYQPATGWVNSVDGYPYATIWDIGSGLMALFAAERLGLLDGDEYDARMRRALRTLLDAGLFGDVAFNKNYSTRTGQIAGRPGQEDTEERGYGWSALDVGRLLVVLHVIDRNHPQYRDLVHGIVGRLDFERLVADGYLRGEDVDSRGRLRRYQEGTLGYEQYAATGFAAWRHEAPHALNVRRNARPVAVHGIPLLADVRGREHLTSDPFVMMGLETGWSPDMRDLAWRVLAAQEARWRSTGVVTMVNEDALTGPPHFLYYSVYGSGRAFHVEAPAGAPPGPAPRTTSVKAAYGWHALLPGSYTWRVIERVQPARGENGWGAGVFEADGRVSGPANVNTAAVVLEAALYVLAGGRPLVEGVEVVW